MKETLVRPETLVETRKLAYCGGDTLETDKALAFLVVPIHRELLTFLLFILFAGKHTNIIKFEKMQLLIHENVFRNHMYNMNQSTEHR